MKSSILILTSLLSFWQLDGLASAQQPTDICTLCFCDGGLSPYLIACEKLKLSSLFSEEEWKYTFEKNKINASALDVRFDENNLEKITKFPALPIASLSFRGNALHSIDPYAFEELDDLVSLDLSDNSFTAKDLPESVFEGRLNVTYYKPLNLQSLNMSNNNIHTIETDLFDHFPYLTSLDLSKNPLKVLGGSTAIAIADLKSLEYLNLAYTGIRDIPAGMIHSLIKLESLDLTGNEFSKIPEELKNAHNLSVLTLDDNRFESFDADSFTGLDSLRELSISHMKSLRLIEGRSFGGMKKLLKFKCHHNRNLDRISNAAFHEIATKPEEWPLKEIHLNDNGLTHIDEALAAWKAVEFINIQNNPFRCNCDLKWMAEELVDQIRRTHPNLVQEIVCAEPKDLKGGSIIELGLEPESFKNCKPGGFELTGAKIQADTQDSGISESSAMSVLVIGVILIVIALSILGVMIVKRRAISSALVAHQEIRYQRAQDEDFEQMATYKTPSSGEGYRVRV